MATLPARRALAIAAAPLLALSLLLIGAGSQAQTLVAVPALTARVIDQAGALTPAQRDALEAKLAAFEAAHGSQIAVLLLPTTAPEPIADYAHRVGEAWKIGRRDVGDGLVVILARDDKRVRIDVARALEGAIPDLAAKKIIRENMSPRFAQGDFAGGLDAGIDALFGLIEKEALPASARQGRVDTRDDNSLETWLMLGFIGLIVGGSLLKAMFGRVAGSFVGAGGAATIAWLVAGSLLGAIAVALIALIFLLVAGAGRGGRSAGFPGTSGSYGGTGSGGSSWGGFSSGGGGDFSGGGASGSWGGGND